MKTFNNQRIIKVTKEPTDKKHIYTMNNLAALDDAVYKLQSKAGIKLWIYMAKNQDNYNFALSSSDFCQWAGVSLTAYNSAFKELVEKGFLIQSGSNKNNYIFYEKSRDELQNETITDNTNNTNNTINTNTFYSSQSSYANGFRF